MAYSTIVRHHSGNLFTYSIQNIFKYLFNIIIFFPSVKSVFRMNIPCYVVKGLGVILSLCLTSLQTGIIMDADSRALSALSTLSALQFEFTTSRLNTTLICSLSNAFA